MDRQASTDEFDFDVLELDDFHPNNYIQAIEAAQIGGYDGLVIDSISHEWSGRTDVLSCRNVCQEKQGGNKWAGWADVTHFTTPSSRQFTVPTTSSPP